jgi:hypothetical protein
MLLGRFFMIVPIMALAGSLAAEESRARQCGHVPGFGRHVRGVAARHRAADRRAELSCRARAWPVVEHFLTLQGKLF